LNQYFVSYDYLYSMLTRFIFIIAIISEFIHQARAQTVVPEHFLGRYTKANIGFDITGSEIQELTPWYDDWGKVPFASFRWLDVISNNEKNVFEAWCVSSFTLRRDTYTNGNEESIEAAVFYVLRLESMNAGKLKISISRPDTIKMANRHPPEIVTTEMLNRWKKKNVFKSTLVLNKTK
jgi:hypothetical protein